MIFCSVILDVICYFLFTSQYILPKYILYIIILIIYIYIFVLILYIYVSYVYLKDLLYYESKIFSFPLQQQQQQQQQRTD